MVGGTKRVGVNIGPKKNQKKTNKQKKKQTNKQISLSYDDLLMIIYLSSYSGPVCQSYDYHVIMI